MELRVNMTVLAVIANHGTGNRQYLDRLLDAYREIPVETHPVILSNISKDLGPDIEVRVGVPSENPWSLPFAHRPLFRERLDEHDFFIYSEDDTLLEWPVLDRFIQSIGELEPNEIAGFMRTETSPDGIVYYSTSHSFFRWHPDTIRQRAGKLWARYSNEHAACFVVSQRQLRSAIESGGFGDEPHEGRYDMLCAAATDIYTQCGLERLVCVDDLEGFSLKHLPNKYIGKMGLPKEEMQWQIEALQRVKAGELLADELLDPETKLPGCYGSKFCREQPDPVLTELVGSSSQRVLSWCAGDGVAEANLAGRGHKLTVHPLDAVLGTCCEKRGLQVLPPVMEALENEFGRYDVVLMRDALHRVENPLVTLAFVTKCLAVGGRINVRVPNLNSAALWRKRMKDPRFKIPWTREAIGATPFTPSSLKRVMHEAGLSDVTVRAVVPSQHRKYLYASAGALRFQLSPFLYAMGVKA